MILEMLEYMKSRFPVNWTFIKNGLGEIIARDNSIDRARGFTVKILEEASYFEACIEFEDYALELFNYADKQLTNSDSPIKTLLEAQKGLQCRRYKRYVEEIFDSKSLRSDGWWLTVEYRKNGNYATGNFIDLLLTIILYIFPYDVEAEEEGLAEVVMLTKYERSRINRSLCIAFHGYDCKACGINLRFQYEEVARQFIHVHHLNPVSTTGITTPDPIKDMIPLCPNCHGIAHLRNPPYTVEEIKNMIKNNNGKLYT